MLKIQGTIPREVGVAVSGGVDSMVALDFLRRRHDVHVYHVNHGTEYGNQAMALVIDYCHKHNIPYTLEFLQKEKPKKKSWEEFWRDERYAFFKSHTHQIAMAHHLDDCVENWAMTACHGNYPHPIGYRHANVFRPFRLNRKDEFIKWAENYQVPYLNDPTNYDPDTKFSRVYVRMFLVPVMLHINPGLHKVVKKVIMNDTQS
jgi:tRNA(Ile)-lysidine synthase